ncbi:hypothetical protein XI04_03840 [Bradyrhizobium sp. CCBAU 11430]|uniref:hypothetical protein n=1 Tax=unclassified Bradyrhizobium TaxID=2631580 RepID=UPI0023066308|nr:MULTISPECIES: hypothetical protein [unclassified Bradyrhizobium]MDA9419316.1 hypothetical protein [Bradyrhizobium sp. CCBAU 25360]MDA9512202.1 hypothetical protein [Bradyrhizobium sp. CCBAU 11430]
MRVSFDSNAWEKIFDPADRDWTSIRTALAKNQIAGFISEAGFRIEAIRKSERTSYFAEPAMQVQFSIVERDGKPSIQMTMGPDDARHPGLHEIQSAKLKSALDAGIRLMRTASWLGLPSPAEIGDPALFAHMAHGDSEREQRQIDALARIEAQGVGRAAFDAAGGWQGAGGVLQNEKRSRKACAEWADGELVAAHIAYRNDILCTNDQAHAAGRSILDPTNRAWLTTEFGIQFATLDELLGQISAT